jgi:hypothetical protein
MKTQHNLKIGRIILFSAILSVIPFGLSGQNETKRAYPQLLFPDFTSGVIKMKSGKTSTASLNYNTVEEEMLFEQNAQFYVVSKLDEIDTVILNNRKFVPVDKAFYEVIVKGNISIYVENRNRFAPVGTKTAYGLTSQTNGPTSINTVRRGGQMRTLDIPENVEISEATLYWVKVGGVMNKFTTERQFSKIFPGKEDKIKDFFKKSKIDIKTAEGLKILGKFCNEQL